MRAKGKTNVALLDQGIGPAADLPQAGVGGRRSDRVARASAPDGTAARRHQMAAGKSGTNKSGTNKSGTNKSGTNRSSVTSWTSELQLLLVEGDSGVAEGYKLKVELDGYVVRVACGRAAAMAALAQSLPDLVFLDVRPSLLVGSEILHDIRATKETRYMPVVVLSNDGKDELIRRGLQLAGGEWVIQSPGRARLGVG